MPRSLITAVISFFASIVGGLISSVVAPYVKNHIETTKSRQETRRAQIRDWRKMLIDIAAEHEKIGGNIGDLIQKHPDYLSLEPYLSEPTRKAAYTRSFYVRVGSSLPEPLPSYKREIEQIAAKWKLI